MPLSRPTRHASRPRTLLLLALPGLATISARASAQYSVAEVQPLAFGYLTQGLTEIVNYADTFRRGVVTVDGAGQVWVRLVLPTTLVSPQGTTITLQFLTGDVAVQEPGRAPVSFDPSASTRVNLGRGTATVLIGGRAAPAANQRAGLYSATMTIIVSSTRI